MPRICIAVVDAVRARLYTYQPGSPEAADRAPTIVEHLDLINPERRPTGASLGLDDHRDLDQRFAGEVYRQLVDLLAELPSRRVVIAASPQTLALLRRWTIGLTGRHIELHEVALDLTFESTPQLPDLLAKLGLTAARRRIGVSA